MQHMLLKAVTTATDQGHFTAVISAASIDREKDIVDPGGMVRALQKWVPTGKNIPLAWNHSTAPEHQIGYIDPKTAREVKGEVVADGWIDQNTPSGEHAWRQVKAGTLGFSFGYLTLASTKRQGGGRLLTELDVFEVTATPTPMNNDTRVLSWKAAVAVEEDEQDTLEVILELLGDFLDTEDDAQDIAAARDILQRVQSLLASEQSETPDDGDPDDGKALLAEGEVKGLADGLLKAVWSASMVNDLPDSAFLYVESGGMKDSDGKTTPRSLRHFPYKDANGNVDLPHLRNALARIPQSNLSQSVKDELTAKAQRILDSQKSVDGTPQAQRRGVDPLRAKAEALALEHASGGLSLKSPAPEKPAPPPDLMPLRELKARMREEMLTALSGGTES